MIREAISTLLESKEEVFSFLQGSNNGISLGYRTDDKNPYLFEYKGYHPDINQYMEMNLIVKKKGSGWITTDGKYTISNDLIQRLESVEERKIRDIEAQMSLDSEVKTFAKRFVRDYEVGDSFKAQRIVYSVWGELITDWYGEDGTGEKKKPFMKAGAKKKIKEISDYGIKVSGFKYDVRWENLYKIMLSYGD